MGLSQIILLAVGVLIVAKLLGIKDIAGLFANTTRVIGFIAVVAALGLMATGRIAAGLGIGIFGLSMMGWDLRAMVLNAILGKGAAPRQKWRARGLELSAAGAKLDGKVLAGRFQGRPLSSLSVEEVKSLFAEFRSDAETCALVQAYLDRRHPRWREDLKGDTAFRESRPARPGTMTDQEAYEILGLQPGAGSAEVMTAYRRLMKAVHPDAGGSVFLAAKVNEARDRLVGKHETRSKS
jgi:hypothetical protein